MATSVCALLSACVAVCAASNVDTSFPVLKTGDTGSLFGLSVSLHLDLKTRRHLLLVGAPRDRAEPNVAANRTGGVYSCPINLDQSDCRRMNLVDPDLNPSEDLIEDMWLGVAVASQGPPGGRVLVCGHRFVKLYGAFQLRHMIGRCYLRGNNLQYNESDMHWQNPEQVCSHLGDVSGEVMCNVGVSAVISQTQVVLGSPGSFNWQGNVHVSWMNPDVVFDSQRNSFPNMERRNIYMGYSVIQAPQLLSKQTETIVTGAPKDSKEDARGSVMLALKHLDKLEIRQTLRGEQMGSYFGNAVAATDLDNDGWSDLLVGAPFYFQRQQEVGGAVYVYMNVGGHLGPQPTIVLRGRTGSAFGMAVAATGDLNQDGFQDFAVGAPFHGSGSVMIWSGSAGGVASEPSQVIHGSRVSSVFKTFGYSLSSGHDVDNNKYPDLLIGSLDDTVVLLRSRPVVHLNSTLRVFPEVVDPLTCDLCIQVEVCFSYMFSTGEKTDQDNITVHFTVTADITSLQPRLRFRDNGQSVLSGFLSMPERRCMTASVSLQNSIRDKVEPLVFSLNTSLHQNLNRNGNTVQDLKNLPVLSDKSRPIRTQIHIQKACGSDNRCHSNLQMAAQFTDPNQKPFSRVKGQQLLVYNGTISLVLLQVNISNTPSPRQPAEDAHNAALSISIPPSLTYSGVRTQGNSQKVLCSGNDTVLHCELGNPFKSKQKVQVLVRFQSDISLDTRDIRTVLQLSTLSEQVDISPVIVSMLVEVALQTSMTVVDSPGPASFSGHVIGESAVKRTWEVGSLLTFTFQVTLTGRMLGHHGNLEVEFEWPMELSNGKWLLYLTEIQMNGTAHQQCDPPGNVINPLKLKTREDKARRRSLQEEEEEPKEMEPVKPLAVFHLQEHKKKFYTLDCQHGASCVTFVCPLTNISNSATLTLRSRLWNSTMMEDFSDARMVLVQGRATLKFRTTSQTIKMTSQSRKIQVLVYPEGGHQLDWPLPPLWIMVVSVLAGVVLLALICLLFWKCGFFVRRGGAWPAAALHQGRILCKDEQHQQHCTDAFLIEYQGSMSSRNRKWKKQWVTTWTDAS